MRPTTRVYPPAPSSFGPLGLVVKSRLENDCAKQLRDRALLPMLNIFGQRFVNRGFLGLVATGLLGLGQQPVVYLKVCGHDHTMHHTIVGSSASFTGPSASPPKQLQTVTLMPLRR